MLFPLGTLPDGPRLETTKALILLDFQNDFVSPSGKLYTENIQTFLPNLSTLTGRFREKGQIVWAHTTFNQPCSDMSPETGSHCILLKQAFQDFAPSQERSSNGHPSPHTALNDIEGAEPVTQTDPEAFLSEVLPDGYERVCVPGTTGIQYPEAIRSVINRQKDLIVGKTQYSAFADITLLMQLRTRMVTDLYICGSLSNISVYATVLDAVRHGFKVTLIEDCLGYRDEICHVNAMREMADGMGVEGIDFQELVDDLAGLLGDVIREEDYATKFQVDISRPSLAEKRARSRQNVSDWMCSIPAPATMVPDRHSKADASDSDTRPGSSDSHHNYIPTGKKSSRQRSSTNETSPPRKRSTNDLDEELEFSPSYKTAYTTGPRRSSYDSPGQAAERSRKVKLRVRRPLRDAELARKRRPSTQQSLSTGDLPDGTSSPIRQAPDRAIMASVEVSRPQQSKKLAKKASQAVLGPNDSIGDGSSHIHYDVLPRELATTSFDILKSKLAWQKMYHRSGAVPRLVCVQGEIEKSVSDGSKTYPIYRHPADESPETLPFDGTVNILRQECEKVVGHELNHVLIQYYRHGEDNISEHSDKTLDIVHGSQIVNLSLGAQRMMTLRTKRSRTEESSDVAGFPNSRTTQRVPLPHNSVFVLSPSTNTIYLHAIRADKRPSCEKSEAEKAYGGQRISLTFRQIGTFVTESPSKNLIWGQGATSKSKSDAREVLSPASAEVVKPSENGGTPPSTVHQASDTPKEVSEADDQQERLIIAFGRENHESTSFDWDTVYGMGFDVVNFAVKAADVDKAQAEDLAVE